MAEVGLFRSVRRTANRNRWRRCRLGRLVGLGAYRRRRIDRLFQPSRRAFELRVLLDGQRFVVNLALADEVIE
jgi:hypothetical protein